MPHNIEKGRFNLSVKKVVKFIVLKDDIRSSKVFSFSIKRILDILLSSFILIVVTITLVIAGLFHSKKR